MNVAALSFVASVLLTYAVHSAAACFTALTIAQLVRRPHDRDVIWKSALIAPMFTAAVAIFWKHAPAIDLANVVRRHADGVLPGRSVMVEVSETVNGTSTVLRRFIDPVAGTLSGVVLSVAVVAVMLAAARLISRRRALGQLLAERSHAQPTEFMIRGRAVVVSTCDELQSPIALGDAEICLPAELPASFGDAHRRALFAHETAHLDRRDPRWIVVTDAIAALSAFQPLVVAVTKAFRRDAELICDETALRETGDRLALIGALALLAAPFDAKAAHAGAAWAVDGSPLVARASRIANVSLSGALARPRRTLVLAIVAASAILLALPVLAPAVQPPERPLDALAPRVKDLGSARNDSFDATSVNADGVRLERVERRRVVKIH